MAVNAIDKLQFLSFIIHINILLWYRKTLQTVARDRVLKAEAAEHFVIYFHYVIK